LFCLSGFSQRVHYFYYFHPCSIGRSPRCPLVVYPCFFTTGCSVCIFCIIFFVLFLASAFRLQSTTFCSSQSYGSAHHTSPHHTASQQYSHLNRTTFAAALLFTRSRSLRFSFFFCLFFCPAHYGLPHAQRLSTDICWLPQLGFGRQRALPAGVRTQ